MVVYYLVSQDKAIFIAVPLRQQAKIVSQLFQLKLNLNVTDRMVTLATETGPSNIHLCGIGRTRRLTVIAVASHLQ